MIQDNVKIHDNFSLEIKSIYEILSEKKKTTYNTLTYLFIPNGLNINNQTYPKSKFYNDVKVYIRYNASEYTLDEILNVKTGPLHQLIKIVKKISGKKVSKKNKLEFESRVKMLGAILNNTLRTATLLLKNNRKSEIIKSIEYFNKLKKVLVIYRDLVLRIEALKVAEDLKNTIKYGDEYISNIINYYLIVWLEFYKINNVDKEILKELIAFIKEEQTYRKLQNFDVTNSEDYFDEILFHKRSQLKKFIESVLFLNRDIRKDGAFFEQSIFAFAAGLAMVFSTAVAFYYQQIYGNFTLPFFIALVVGYMFKDRIKASIGLLFVSRASSFYHDFKIKIKDSGANLIGIVKENFTFVPFNKLGPKVKKHRLKNKFIAADYNFLGEQIIQYKKKIVIYPKKFGEEISDNRLNSIVDITRINLYRFTTQMDDPKKEYSLLKKGKIINRVGNRIYHINLIQKFYTEKGITFKRYLVIMNRKGIKRIEPIELDAL
ncbi:hypothetical protein MHL31_12410 [Lutibacter sp. A80]|uniref:hypothetical protein n=1 Tax=Lutibacter sp. A80 TaxID=2918453 RepID=UPI001F059910|nr:hypothetical protein [Lutibacter sp. A80]UMB59874.1 hypothetical protein MHL31_12410 [Lutibacter sp. A80]